jgi:hypothetical protein
MNFIDISKIIFENKSKYNTITDKDKEDAYYMINKKLSLCVKDKKSLSVISNFFNHKSKDRDNNYKLCRASALDLWFLYLKGVDRTPGVWYAKSPFTKTEKKEKSIPKADKEMIMEYENLSEKEFEFLSEHYRDELEYKIKILKRAE